MFSPILRAFGQLDDPALRQPLWQSLAIAAASFVIVIALVVAGLHQWLIAHAWLGWLAGALGGLLTAVAALWLFVPLAVLIASQLIEPICRAVERRWYPDLPPPEGAGLAVQTWVGLVIAFQILVLNLAALALAVLLPGIGVAIGWAVAAWALGRGMFAGVALRRFDRAGADRVYRARRLSVWSTGAVLAAMGTVPLLNLLIPIVGTAAMVHVLAERSR